MRMRSNSTIYFQNTELHVFSSKRWISSRIFCVQCLHMSCFWIETKPINTATTAVGEKQKVSCMSQRIQHTYHFSLTHFFLSLFDFVSFFISIPNIRMIFWWVLKKCNILFYVCILCVFFCNIIDACTHICRLVAQSKGEIFMRVSIFVVLKNGPQYRKPKVKETIERKTHLQGKNEQYEQEHQYKLECYHQEYRTCHAHVASTSSKWCFYFQVCCVLFFRLFRFVLIPEH